MLKLSPLAKTWIFDVDGTIVKHNGHKIDGHDTLLEGVKVFFDNLALEDKVILLTARKEHELEELKSFLKNNNIRYDYMLSDVPVGERVRVDDKKPSRRSTTYAVIKERDEALDIKYVVDKNL